MDTSVANRVYWLSGNTLARPLHGRDSPPQFTHPNCNKEWEDWRDCEDTATARLDGKFSRIARLKATGYGNRLGRMAPHLSRTDRRCDRDVFILPIPPILPSCLALATRSRTMK